MSQPTITVSAAPARAVSRRTRRPRPWVLTALLLTIGLLALAALTPSTDPGPSDPAQSTHHHGGRTAPAHVLHRR